MHKHIRNAVLAFICSAIWCLLFFADYGEIAIFHSALRGFLAIGFFINGIMEIRNHKKRIDMQVEKKDREI